MKKASVRHEFACDVETFWKWFFDDEYQAAFYRDGLGFPDVKVLEKTETTRKIRVVPKLSMPAAVAKVLGDSFSYEEHGTFDKAKNEYTWRMVPNTMKDKLSTFGTVKVEPLGEGRVRRLNDVTLDAKIFGIGGMIESSAEKDVVSSWEKEAVFFAKWLEKTKA